MKTDTWAYGSCCSFQRKNAACEGLHFLYVRPAEPAGRFPDGTAETISSCLTYMVLTFSCSVKLRDEKNSFTRTLFSFALISWLKCSIMALYRM